MTHCCCICNKILSEKDKIYHVPINWTPPMLIKDVESLCGTVYNINFMMTQKQKQSYHSETISDKIIIYHDKICACSLKHLFEFCDNTKDHEFSKSLPLFWNLYKDEYAQQLD